ncbi:hypothetical protein ABID22_000036 [Pontibacter aydingkolensis]
MSRPFRGMPEATKLILWQTNRQKILYLKESKKLAFLLILSILNNFNTLLIKAPNKAVII